MGKRLSKLKTRTAAAALAAALAAAPIGAAETPTANGAPKTGEALPSATFTTASVEGKKAEVSFKQQWDEKLAVGFELQFSEDLDFKKGVSTFRLRAADLAKTTLTANADGTETGTYSSSANGAKATSYVIVKKEDAPAATLDGRAGARYRAIATFSKKGRFTGGEATGEGSTDGYSRYSNFTFTGTLRKKIPSGKNLYARARLAAEGAAGSPSAYRLGGWSKPCLVVNKDDAPKPVRRLTFAYVASETMAVAKGKKENIQASAFVDGTEVRRLDYESLDPSIAKVNSKGVVTGVRQGVTSVDVSAEGLHVATVKVQVTATKKKTKAIDLRVVPCYDEYPWRERENRSYVVVGASYSLVAVVAPKNVAKKKVKWSSTNPKVVRVDARGVVETVGVGKATIVAKTVDGSKLTAKLRLTAGRKEKYGVGCLFPDAAGMVSSGRRGEYETNAYGVHAMDAAFLFRG